jgi:hypothetical protein
VNLWWLFAGGVAAFSVVLHVMLGRLAPARQLGEADRALRPLALYGRHATTLALAAFAFGFAHAARAADAAADLAFALTGLALALGGLRLATALMARARRLDFEEWGPLIAVGALGAAGVMAA